MATIEEKIQSKNITVWFHEVLVACGEKKTREERIQLLRAWAAKSPINQKIATQTMECLTHPKVVMDLPEGIPPLKETSDITDFNTALLQYAKMFLKVPYFVKGHPNYIKQTAKRESVFIQALESMYRPDAILFCMVKDKKMDTKVYRGVNNQLLIDAFGSKDPEAVAKN